MRSIFVRRTGFDTGQTPKPARRRPSDSCLSPGCRTPTAARSRAIVSGVPISLREAGNTDPNNPVSRMVVNLCFDTDAPLERLKAIRASANVGK